MADEADDDVLELNEDQEIDEQEEQEDQDDELETGEEDPDEGEEETVITIGDDEAPPASGDGDNSTIRQMRSQLRELKRENDELRKGTAPQAIEIGDKPTLESCEWDEEKLEAELFAWRDRKAEADKAKTDAQRQQEAAREQWQKELRGYEDGKTKLGFPDVQEAEDTVISVLDAAQQTVIVKAADNPALVIYSLAKHPQRLEALSQIKDPLKLAAAVAKLEGALKVTTRKKAPAPEKIARGNASVSAKAADKELERLEKAAEKSGDRTALIQYRKKLNAQAK